MCGVYGISYKNRDIVDQMIKDCSHRGPDGQDIYVDEKVTLGHNLLFITENPEQSRQPWKTPKGNILTYNGEIFNYYELVHKYKDKFIPKTKCDTELLAWGLDNFGYNFIEQIDSMHAFVFYDKQKQQLILSTDHLGIKPLYYAIENNNLIFSSEIKSMLANVKNSNQVSKEGIASFQYCGMNVLDQTIFNKIKKLTPGETIIYDLYNKKILEKKYQRIVPQPNHYFDPDEFREQVRNTVKMTSIGIRDFGIFLSGGLDSSIVAYEMNKVNPNTKTFTNRFEVKDDFKLDQGYNSDANVAKLLAQQENFNHTEVLITPDILCEYWEGASKYNEECIQNPSNFVYYYTNKFMKQNGVTITMSGDMGDELFTGYHNHLNFTIKHKVKTSQQFVDYFAKLNSASPFNIPEQYPIEEIRKKFKKLYVDDIWNEQDPLGSYMAIECLTVVPNEFLRRNDKFGMANSIEGRFPFTTKSFMNYCFSIHSSEKINYKTGELKLPSKIAYQHLLPKDLLTKVKTGWSAPFGHWLHTNKGCKNLLLKSVDWPGPHKKAGRKTYKKLFRKWLYNDWKRHYNLV